MTEPVPVPPFGASRAGVIALVPDVTLFEGAVPAGRRGVTEGQVDAWLAELSARVARRLDGFERLSDQPAEGEELSDLAKLISSARDVVHNGAASYLEAARHPEQAGKSSTSYAAVLWQRFIDGLDELAGWLSLRLTAGGVDPATGLAAPSLDYAFPDPSFTAGLRF